MIKYSIIIPTYNAASYLSKCLDSVLNQDREDYEIIIINDGSTDKSEDIINQYRNEKIKYYYKENGGVSDARNYGIDKVEGQYFLFVDADDYVSKNLLNTIDRETKKDPDIISFNISLRDKFDRLTGEVKKPVFDSLTGQQAIIRFINNSKMFDTPVAYVYKTSYIKSNDFKYAKGRVHEDFGLTPLLIIKASKVISISNNLYFYVQHDNSITSDISPEKLSKKAWDMLYHFDYLYLNVNSDIDISDKAKKLFNSFIANAVISKSSSLKGDTLKEYIKELKNRHVPSLLLNDTISRKVKKLLMTLNIGLYLKLFAKRR
ncbi:MAG: glycosyltransferase family 2 protein [Bacilli bacterium]|jgi:glycosyltransferase involved in cell wall biosynthesis